ncbi:sialate O-acetylesterase [Jiulongibacter sediminis]|uniref:sialate O-acetylesterase n=1 Tax=Jiulongibacter sediminis TaxID=1605367 RepID=UPI0006DC5030|nr:sialate O-acetylesterase [Jiulongibacter sediminis]
MKRSLLAFLFIGLSLSARAQLDIHFPVERSVFQRDLNNQGKIYISAAISQRVDSVQARLIEYTGSEESAVLPWQNIDNQSAKGYVLSSLTIKGGWYRLELRAFSNGDVVFENQVNKVGVGEVFVISGQSNAQGVPNYGGTGSKDDRVNCADFHNNTDSYDPQLPLQFSHLDDNSNIGPNGLTPWIWGEIGDSLVNRLGVPVMFFNSAETGTLSYNWWQASRNEFTLSAIFQNFFKLGFPYHNLKISLQQYASLFGVRAVLWHQGETDTSPGVPREDEIFGYYKEIIENTRNDYGKNVAWMFSKVSYSGGFLSDAVINAQTRIINEPGFNIFEGPFTDNLQIPRPDGVHFQNTAQVRGLGLLADAWLGKLTESFFEQCQPILEDPLVEFEIFCENNNSAKLKIPEGYSAYRWNDGQTAQERVFSNGQWNAALRTEGDNLKFSNSVNIEAIRFNAPAAPTVEKTLLCPDESDVLTADLNYQNFVWNTEDSTSQIEVSERGQYSFLAENSIGCQYQSPVLTIEKQEKPDFVTNMAVEANGGVHTSDTAFVVCAGIGLNLKALGDWNAVVWSDSSVFEERSLTNSQNLTYIGSYGEGCFSQSSPEISFTVIENPPSPTISVLGLSGIQILDKSADTEILWFRDEELVDSETEVLKVSEPGTFRYTAREIRRISEDLTCSSELSNSLSFSVSETDFDKVFVYPNPASEIIYLESYESHQNFKADLFDAAGKHVLSLPQLSVWKTRVQIPVQGLAPGKYNLLLQSGDFVIRKKVMVR